MKVLLCVLFALVCYAESNPYRYSQFFEEWDAIHTEFVRRNPPKRRIMPREISDTDVDLRVINGKELLREIDDQNTIGDFGPRSCKSCYAFAAVHNVQDNWNIREGKKMPKLSVQHVLTCDKNRNPNPCNNPGLPSEAAAFALENSVTDECEPYNVADLRSEKSCSEKCADGTDKSQSHIVLPNDVLIKAENNADKQDVIEMLRKGQTVLTTFQVTLGLYFHLGNANTKTTVYSQDSPDFILLGFALEQCEGYHAVNIVGYVEGNPNYWIIKNSWGVDSGDEGYFYIDADTANVIPDNANLLAQTGGAARQSRLVYATSLTNTQGRIVDQGLNDISNNRTLGYLLHEAASFVLFELDEKCNVNGTDYSYRVDEIAFAEILASSNPEYQIYFNANTTEPSCDELEFNARVMLDFGEEARGQFVFLEASRSGPELVENEFNDESDSASTILFNFLKLWDLIQ